MAYISARGTASAALILALAVSPGAILRAAETSDATSAGSLEVTVTNVKNSKGVIRLAICGPDTDFPKCDDDAVRTTTMKIDEGTAQASFADIPAGTYAVSVFHDANVNGKLDTMLGIPREGYGFSGNPPFRPRAPRFDEAQIEVRKDTKTTIRLRYLL